jgi:transposase-like protein
VATGRGALIPQQDRTQLMELLKEGLPAGASVKAIANLIGICARTLRRWGSHSRPMGSARTAAGVLRGW